MFEIREQISIACDVMIQDMTGEDVSDDCKQGKHSGELPIISSATTSGNKHPRDLNNEYTRFMTVDPMYMNNLISQYKLEGLVNL